LPKIDPKEKKLVGIVSAILGVVMVILTIVAYFVFHFTGLPFTWDQVVILAIMVAIFPTAAVEYLDLRWQRGIDKNIPRLLREIAESGRTGLTLVRAVEVSADRDYGPLTAELKQMVAQISWGGSLEDALQSFGVHARTKLARRTADLIAEVARSGGDTQEIMEQLNKHIGELQSIDRERNTQMRPYAAVVYIAFGVFLFTDVMLVRSFFTQILQMQNAVLNTAGGSSTVFGGIASVNIGLLKTILFHAVIIQAIIGGLVAGKMSEARLGAGLKHVLILMLMAFAIFAIFVWSA
jgi:archaeal flagellar protein FlaJ